MLRSKIGEIRNKIRQGAPTAETLSESLNRIESEDGKDVPVLCRSPEELKVADQIEWTELMEAARSAKATEADLRHLEEIRARYLSTPEQNYKVFEELGHMPPTVAFTIAIANLNEEEGKCKNTAALIRRDLLNLNDSTLCKALRSAVSEKRPVHAFLRREEKAAVLELADELDEKLHAGERLPLAGVAIAVKDVFALGRTTAASRILSEYTAPPEYVATAVRKLLRAGAVSMGKTNLDEFALGSFCTSTAFWPAPRNPHNRARVAGGSSGGSAAAVAAGMVVGAVGSDTAGSIRVPASFCGVVGVKPTYGLVSRFGLFALASSLDCVGPIADTVADAAILLGHMVGGQPDAFDQTVRRRALQADFDPETYASPLLGNDAWSTALRGMKVGIPIEYFLAYDLDDQHEVEEILAQPFDFDDLMKRRDDPCLNMRRSGRQVDQFITWMRTQQGKIDNLTKAEITKLWEDFSKEQTLVFDLRDKLESCRDLWDRFKDLIRWLQGEFAIEFRFVSLRHTWLSIPVYFVISRQELASNLHRYDGLKYGRPEGSLSEPFEVAATLNRSTCFGVQPKQRILMGIHVLQAQNKERLLRRAKQARSLIRQDFDRVFSEVDLLLAPTVNTVAPIFGGPGDTVAEQYMDEFSVPANHAGVPAISIPLYREREGWQSAQVIASEFDEGRMFLLAAAIEEYRSRKEPT